MENKHLNPAKARCKCCRYLTLSFYIALKKEVAEKRSKKVQKKEKKYEVGFILIEKIYQKIWAKNCSKYLHHNPPPFVAGSDWPDGGVGKNYGSQAADT